MFVKRVNAIVMSHLISESLYRLYKTQTLGTASCHDAYNLERTYYWNSFYVGTSTVEQPDSFYNAFGNYDAFHAQVF